jgi:type IV pilus assembly protein PilY1
MKKFVYLSLLLIFLIPFGHAFANDTDLYILTQLMQQVPPDTLILLDLSGSMSNYPTDQSTYTLYINSGTCTTSHGHTTCPHNCGDTNIPYYTTNASPNTTACTINSTDTIYGDPTCAGPYYYTYNQTGNSASQTTCTQSKVAIAQRALFKLLDADNGTGTGTPDGIINSNDQAYLKIRMGYMRYYNCGSSSPEVTGYPETNTSSYNSGCNTLIDPINTPYYQIYCNESTSCTPSGAAKATSIETETASGGTPLAAALQEANYYLTYTKTQDNDAACRQKFVILITDGDDTYACGMNGSEGETKQYKGRREVVAQARALANAGYYVFAIGFGSAMPSFEQNTLNWVAYYGNTKNSNTTQSVTTMYTIPYGQIYPSGVTQCMSSSQVMGPYTGTGAPYYGYTYYYANSPANSDPGQDAISGYAFLAQNESDLNAAISNIRNFILALIAQSTSYVAPVVPISQYQKSSSEGSMYLGMFEPTNTTMWNGNIKKYGIVSTATSTLTVGEVVDENGNVAIPPNSSTILPTAQSYWSPSSDGGNVEVGGVGGLILASNLNSRNIYTYLGTNTDLTNSSNAFSTVNAAITPALLGVSTPAAVQNIINFAHGWDVYNWNNGPGNPRQWILGAIIHSKPMVIHYGNQDVIYIGANDGMLHAFDNATGNELWAFIPPDLLRNLQNFGNSLTSLQIFVDGSPKSYVTYTYNSDGSINSVTQAILIFGERRGGNNYTALDVTNPSDPKFLWSISPTQIRYQTTTTASTAYQEMGQSWSTPILGQIKNGSGTKWVAFIAGGYDATNEDTLPPGTDTSGRAVYVVDILTGNQIWKYSFSNDSNMKYCIPSDITAISVKGDGLIERLYVGDVGGQMWRFDIGNMNNTGSWTGYRVFKGIGKIFYPPDVTFETNKGNGTYDMLFFGTGDREKPNDTTVTTANPNRLYAIKDYDNDTNPPIPLPLTESNLVDVTSDVLQSSTSTSSAKTNVLQNLQSSMGWYIQLNQSAGENPNPGEKCDASTVVLGGAVYYTTFTPTPVNTQSVCTIGTGQGNVYILQYQTGNAMFTLSNDTTLTASDRSMGVGAGIPSGIVITVINGTVTGYGGVAGGVFYPKLNINNSIVPLDWRIVF